MSGRTPGPWWCELNGEHIVANVIDGHAAPIARALRTGEVSGSTRVPLPIRANSALMAAAPDLLAALVKTLAAMEMQEKREAGEFHIAQPAALNLWNDAKEMAHSAIAKTEKGGE